MASNANGTWGNWDVGELRSENWDVGRVMGVGEVGTTC